MLSIEWHLIFKEIIMFNKGLRQYRFMENPIEKIFAEEWDRLNSIGHHSTLDYLLAKEPNHPKGEVTDRDREVAATVIQWLGSPVGQNFLKDVQIRVDKI